MGRPFLIEGFPDEKPLGRGLPNILRSREKASLVEEEVERMIKISESQIMRNQATYYIIGHSKTLVLFLMRWESIKGIDHHR